MITTNYPDKKENNNPIKKVQNNNTCDATDKKNLFFKKRDHLGWNWRLHTDLIYENIINQ